MQALAMLLLALTVTVEPAKKEVTLGEPVDLKVDVKADGDDKLGFPVFFDKRSVSLTIGSGKDQFVYQRSVVGGPNSDQKSATISWTPTKAGEYDIEANYAGKASGSTKVTVKAAEGGDELVINMETTKGPMKIRFFPEVAPNHVAHFAERVRTGFYDGLVFHRVIKNFMAQGGDPTGTGSGGPGYSIPAEFTKKDNPDHKKYSHTFGRLSTARTSDPNSAGSQFFLCFDQAGFLDHQYTVLGEVYEGQDNLRKIEAIGAERDPQKPKELVKITKATLVPVKSDKKS